MAAFYSTGLVLVGLNFGFLIGLVAGLLGFIPFVGALIGFIVSLGVALVQFWPDWIMIAATLSVFVVGQMLENYLLQPRLIGQNVGLHPVWVMFALLAFGYLFGFVGVLLAIPAAAAVGVLVRYGLKRYRESPIYRGGSSSES
jgi:predicted PurR-regulated permease PerM